MGTRRQNDVDATSLRRIDVVTTSCACWEFAPPLAPQNSKPWPPQYSKPSYAYVIGQRQKAPNFSAFHWSQHENLISIGQHFVTMKVVHLPKGPKQAYLPNRTEADLIIESVVVVVVVVLMFYVHGKHLRSCRDDQLT